MSVLDIGLVVFAGLILGNLISFISWCLPQVMGIKPTPPENLCSSKIKWWWFLPLLSWIKAVNLIAKTPTYEYKFFLRYPAVELLSLVLLGLAVYLAGISWQGGLFALLFLWLLLIAVIDLEYQLILDALSLPLLWIGLLINAFRVFATPKDAILGAVLGYGVLWLLYHIYKLATAKEPMGYGDFKLLAALGAWLGFGALPSIILIAALSSIAIGLILILIGRANLRDEMAFGPYLALGGIVSLYFLAV